MKRPRPYKPGWVTGLPDAKAPSIPAPVMTPYSFVRSAGRLDWTCPSCQKLNLTFRKARYQRLHCNGCDRQFEHGILLYPVSPGVQSPPTDTLFIAGGFVVRRTVNRVFCESCGIKLTEDRANAGKNIEVKSPSSSD